MAKAPFPAFLKKKMPSDNDGDEGSMPPMRSAKPAAMSAPPAPMKAPGMPDFMDRAKRPGGMAKGGKTSMKPMKPGMKKGRR